MSGGTTIIQCGCGTMPGNVLTPAQAFQDKTYGRGRRVCNYTAKETARCTCCSREHRVTDNVVRRKKSGSGGVGRTYIAVPPPGGWLGGEPGKNGYHG